MRTLSVAEALAKKATLLSYLKQRPKKHNEINNKPKTTN